MTALAALDENSAWIFDLDNTLYDGNCGFWQQIDLKIREAVAHFLQLDPGQAAVVQKNYARVYGTTLAGMVAEHQTDPQAFLRIAHDIDYDVIPRNPRLADILDHLPGKKFIYTNADTNHVTAVLERLGLDGAFAGVVDFLMLGGRVKPDPGAFRAMLTHFQLDPASQPTTFFDDLPRNLNPAKSHDIVTVLVNNGIDTGSIDPTRGDADFETHDLTAFLSEPPPAFLRRLSHKLRL